MRLQTNKMILAALFTALTTVGAFIKIPVFPVPVTLQFFFTALSGILLGPYWGAASQIVYVLLGLTGVPVFAGGGGLFYVFNPSFGYLIGFIAASFLIGIVVKAGSARFISVFSACLLGSLAMYLIGVCYLYIILRFMSHAAVPAGKLLISGFLIFLPGEIVKCVAASLLGTKMMPVLKRLTQA